MVQASQAKAPQNSNLFIQMQEWESGQRLRIVPLPRFF